MKVFCLHLLVVAYNELYVILAQLVSPLHFLNEDEKTDIRNNLYSENFSVVTDFLRRNKFKVLDFEDGSPPMVLQGDITVPVNEIITDALEDRTTTLVKAKDLFWKISDAAPHVHYFLDSATKPDADMIHKAVKKWMDNTCIKFTELPSGNCSKTSPQAAVCVKGPPSEGCYSSIGMRSAPNQAAQILSLGKSCDLYAATHEFGHALGFNHMQSRSDRDQFISVHPENIKVDRNRDDYERDFGSAWVQMLCKFSKEEYNLPAPYDFVSIMHYDFNSFGDDIELKGVYMTRDIRYQHMFLYKREAGYSLSFYDLFIINTAYGCVKEWTKTCKANGKKTPKCGNLGYVGVNCTCLCPPAFAGPSCKKKVSDLLLLPLPKAQVQVEVTKAKTVRFKASQFTRQPPEPHSEDFNKHIQFVAVVIRGKNDTYAAVFMERDLQVTSALRKLMVDYFIDSTLSLTSQHGVMVLWGSSSRGLIRAEFTSSYIVNEKDGNWLRSRSNELDMLLRCGLGKWTADDLSVRYFLSLKLHVSFEPRGDQLLKAQECRYPSYCGRPAAVGALMSAVTSVTGIAVIAGVAALVLLLIAVSVCCACKRKRQRDGADTDSDSDDDEKGKSRDSDSTSSDTSSDEGWFTRGGD